MDGILVVDKPAGPTSHDIVQRMRRLLKERSIGHTGTLDPMATGVLVLVLGRATRLAKFLSASDKSYEAVVTLGQSTDSYDADGEPVGDRHTGPLPSRLRIDGALDEFRGTFLQQPPAYSAKKVGGERSYNLARAAARDGASRVQEAPAAVRVTAHAVELLSVDDESVTLRLDCSTGFYVRSLAHDLGERLGTGAHLSALRRTRVGDFELSAAMTLDVAEQDPDEAAAFVIPMPELLPRFPAVVLNAEGVLRASHGRDLSSDHIESTLGSSTPGGKAPGNRGLGDCGLGDSAPGTLAPGTIAPGTIAPGTIAPGTIAPGTLAPGTSTQHPAPSTQHPFVRLLDRDGGLVGIGEPGGSPGSLHPSIVLM